MFAASTALLGGADAAETAPLPAGKLGLTDPAGEFLDAVPVLDRPLADQQVPDFALRLLDFGERGPQAAVGPLILSR